MINKLEPGDRQLSASSWNEMRDRINNITPNQDTVLTSKQKSSYITVKNNTGSALPALSVVKLTTPIYNRSGDTFVNKGVEFGVEMDATTPVVASDTIAITQAACPAGGIVKAVVSGATAVIIDVPTAGSYPYAKPIAGDSSKLEATNNVTPIKILYNYPAAGTQPGYVLIGTDDRLTFTVPTSLASIAKKGAVFKIYLSQLGWQVRTGRGWYILAVCQEDMDSNATESMQMPFYTPEQNCGERPDVTETLTNAGENHVGVISGEYEFSEKRLDYVYNNGQYAYCPTFVYRGAAVNMGTASNPILGISIQGHTYAVQIGAGVGGSVTDYPDIYEGDIITVLVTDGGGTAYSSGVTAIEYPTDYAKGTVILTPDFTLQSYRGWDDVTSYYPNLPAGIYAMQKIAGNALI